VGGETSLATRDAGLFAAEFVRRASAVRGHAAAARKFRVASSTVEAMGVCAECMQGQ